MSAASPPPPGPTARPDDPVIGRFLHLESCARDPVLRSAEWAVCAGDVVHWLTTWGWTEDSREVGLGRPSVLPFVPYPRQVEFLDWLREREARQEDGVA